nr:response regulator transcription factor [Stenotrophomonas sp. VV52]
MGRAQAWPTQRLFDNALIADPHLVVAQGVAGLLSRVVRSTTVVGSGEELIESARNAAPSLVVTEVKMLGISGIDAMVHLRSQGCKTPFLFLTTNAEPAMALMAIRAGARAYLPKTVAIDELLRALENVAGGRSYVAPHLTALMIAEKRSTLPVLTPMQLRILQSISDGVGTKELAALLGVSVRTVESHKYVMMQELKVHTTLQLLRKARAEGLIGA